MIVKLRDDNVILKGGLMIQPPQNLLVLYYLQKYNTIGTPPIFSLNPLSPKFIFQLQP